MLPNVIIATVIKDVAPYLENHIRKTLALGERLKAHWKLVIYENNSKDKTKNILEKYKNHPHCKIISEDLSSEDIRKNSKIWAYTKITKSDHPCRIEQICNARNKLLNELSKPEYDTYNIVVFLDFSLKEWNLHGLLEAITLVWTNKKLVLCGNSYPYYDFYALRASYSPLRLLGPELIGSSFWTTMKKTPFQPSTNIYSAFNGVGVYPKEILHNFRYDCLVTPSIRSFYQTILSNHPELNHLYKTILTQEDPSFPGGTKDTFCVWKNNSGYDQPVICEHISLNAHLLEQQYQLRIYPNLLVLPRLTYIK